MPKDAAERPRRRIWVHDPRAPSAEKQRKKKFSGLCTDLADSFNVWLWGPPEPADYASHTDKGAQVQLIRFSGRKTERLAKHSDYSVAELLVMQGYIPTAPSHIKTAFSVELLVLWGYMRKNCRSLDMATFLKQICAFHGVTYIASMKKPFESAFESVYKPLLRQCRSGRIEQELLGKCPIPAFPVLEGIFGSAAMSLYRGD